MSATTDAHALLNQRNREGDLPPPAQWNEVLETILNHRSVRGFLPDTLPDGTLDLLMAAAQSASTSSNLQVWSVVAVEDRPRGCAGSTGRGHRWSLTRASPFGNGRLPAIVPGGAIFPGDAIIRNLRAGAGPARNTPICELRHRFARRDRTNTGPSVGAAPTPRR